MEGQLGTEQAIGTLLEVKQTMVDLDAKPSTVSGIDDMIDLTNQAQQTRDQVVADASALSGVILGLDGKLVPHEDGAEEATVEMLNTIKSLTDTMEESALGSVDEMVNGVANTSQSIVESGQQASRQLMGQTASTVAYLEDTLDKSIGTPSEETKQEMNAMLDCASECAQRSLEEAQKQSSQLMAQAQEQRSVVIVGTQSRTRDLHGTARDFAVCMLGQNLGNVIANRIFGNAPSSSFSAGLSVALSSMSNSTMLSADGISSLIMRSVMDTAAGSALSAIKMASFTISNYIEAGKRLMDSLKNISSDVSEKIPEVAEQIMEKGVEMQNTLTSGASNLLDKGMLNAQDDAKKSQQMAIVILEKISTEVTKDEKKLDPEDPEPEFPDTDGNNYPIGV